MREISTTAVRLIKQWEKFMPKAYQDSVGVWTQGYGHIRTVSRFSQPIDERTASALLKTDVQLFAEQLAPILKGIELRQCQYDAIVVLVYNIGSGAFRRSKLYQLMKVNPDDYAIADEWIEFRKAGGKYLRGLMRRRIDELALYYSW